GDKSRPPARSNCLANHSTADVSRPAPALSWVLPPDRRHFRSSLRDNPADCDTDRLADTGATRAIPCRGARCPPVRAALRPDVLHRPPFAAADPWQVVTWARPGARLVSGNDLRGTLGAFKRQDARGRRCCCS